MQKINTGNKDFTIKQTADGIEYESEEQKTTTNVFIVAKKVKTYEGYMITTIDGTEYELFEGFGQYDEEDIKAIRKGSVAGFIDTDKTGFFVCGYSTDFIEKEIKKYFGGAEEPREEESEETFELKNTESWTENQFVERDPWNQDATSRIVLCVNWEDKTANVETRPDSGSYPVREYNGLDYTFSIPDTTDFSEFPAYYSEHIRPCIKELSNAFEATWNGSNFVGRFNFNEAPEDHGTEFYMKTEHINDLIREAPQTEKVFYLDVGDSFADYRDIVEVLENEQIDFITVDLDNPENVTEIREVLEEWSTYIMDDDEFRADLLRMRESILEDG